MTRSLSKRMLPVDVILRALAISMVVFNHASQGDRPFELNGGLMILFLLNGYSLARFAFSAESGQSIRNKLMQFGINLLLPCLLIVLLSFLAKREFSLAELLFVSNWISVDHIGILYTWYPQVFLQILLFLYVLFWIPAIPRHFLKNRLIGTLVFLSASLALLFATEPLFNPPALQERLPQFVLWQIMAGACLFFMNEKRETVALKFILMAILFLFLLLTWQPATGYLRLLTFLGSMALLLYVDRIALPGPAAKITLLVSQATFVIFLLHAIALSVFAAVMPGYGESYSFILSILAFIFAMALGVGYWVFWTAFTRTLKRRLRAGSSTSRDHAETLKAV